MSTSTDTMKNFFNVLKLYANDTTTNGVTILDHAIRTTTHFSSLQDAVNNFVSDMSKNLAVSYDPYQTIYDTCGIKIGDAYDLTAETGAVSGYYLGNDVFKDAQTIVPEAGVDLSQLDLPAAGSTTYHSYTGDDGQTFNYSIVYPSSVLEVVDVATSPKVYNAAWGGDFPDSALATTTTLQADEYYFTLKIDGTIESSIPARSGEEIAQSIVTMTKGVENFWADEALKLAYDSFGLDFNGKTLTLKFGINEFALAETGPVATDIGHNKDVPATNIAMMINSVNYTPISSTDVNGNTYIEDGNAMSYTDRVISHELIHALMYASGTLKGTMPQFFTEGVAEFVHGIADFGSRRRLIMLGLATDNERLAKALDFRGGTGTRDSYPAGYMFLTYMCNQSLDTQLSIGTGETPELFAYTGGEEILSGEATGSQINFASGINAVSTSADETDFFVGTTAGNLIVRDARGKILNFANETGVVTGRGYLATDAGTIDGRTFGEYEFICGANNEDNEIYAGNGGAKLWGGSYGNDILFGGNGADEFVAGIGCGSDFINNADSNDVINLAATTLEQITGINATSGGVEMTFADGSTLNVVGSQNTNFKLGDNSAYTYNSGTWTKTA